MSFVLSNHAIYAWHVILRRLQFQLISDFGIKDIVQRSFRAWKGLVEAKLDLDEKRCGVLTSYWLDVNLVYKRNEMRAQVLVNLLLGQSGYL